MPGPPGGQGPLELPGRPARRAPARRAGGQARRWTRTLPPHYFERLLLEFDGDAKLGMASGTRCELIGGRWQPRPLTRSTIAGQCSTYRLACWEAIQPLEPHMGWDGIDEARAVLAGWQVHPIPELFFRHHRPRGRRDGSAWRARSAEGSAAHYMGYRPRNNGSTRSPACTARPVSARDALGLGSGEPSTPRTPLQRCGRPLDMSAPQQAARHFGRRFREARGQTG